MGRLFWKLVIVFWIALLLSGYGVATVVRLNHESVRGEARALLGGPRAEFAVNSAASVLKYGGPEALKDLLAAEGSDRGPQLRVVAQQDSGHAVVVDPVHPGLCIDRWGVVAGEESVAVKPT